MKRKWILRTGVVCAALMMAATGFSVSAQEAAKEQQTEAPDREHPESSATVNGQVIDILDYSCNLEDASAEKRWIVLSDGSAKGFGTAWLAMNMDKDITLWAEEGAEIFIGTNGILRLSWRDAATDEYVGTDTLFFGLNEEPVTANLYAQTYNWDGTLAEEKEITSFTQKENANYFSEVSPLLDPVLAEQGAAMYHEGNTYLTFQDDNGDAVAFDSNGAELIRYPALDASTIRGTISEDGKILGVCFSNTGRTELFELN